MPIKGLAEPGLIDVDQSFRFIRLGRINKGKRVGDAGSKSMRMIDLDYFRFTPYAADQATKDRMNELFVVAYGEKPTSFDDVRFAADLAGNFKLENYAWKFAKKYAPNKPPLFLAMSNGEDIVRARSDKNARVVSSFRAGDMPFEAFTKLDKDGRECFEWNGRLYPWQNQIRLDLIFPKYNDLLHKEHIRGHGIITLTTSSLWDISSLPKLLDGLVGEIADLFANPLREGHRDQVKNFLPLRDFPLRLYREERDITTPAYKTKNNPKPTPDQRMAGRRSFVMLEMSPDLSIALNEARTARTKNLLQVVSSAGYLTAGATKSLAAINDELFGDDQVRPVEIPATVIDDEVEFEIEDDEDLETAVQKAVSEKLTEEAGEVDRKATENARQAILGEERSNDTRGHEKASEAEFWPNALRFAKSLDSWSTAAYQLPGFENVFKDATGVKRARLHIRGQYGEDVFTEDENQILYQAVKVYVEAMTDGAAVREAKAAAIATYKRLKAEGEEE